MGAPTTLLHPASFSQRVLPEMQVAILLDVAAVKPDILERIITQGCQCLCKRAPNLAPRRKIFGITPDVATVQGSLHIWHYGRAPLAASSIPLIAPATTYTNTCPHKTRPPPSNTAGA